MGNMLLKIVVDGNEAGQSERRIPSFIKEKIEAKILEGKRHISSQKTICLISFRLLEEFVQPLVNLKCALGEHMYFPELASIIKAG